MPATVRLRVVIALATTLFWLASCSGPATAPSQHSLSSTSEPEEKSQEQSPSIKKPVSPAPTVALQPVPDGQKEPDAPKGGLPDSVKPLAHRLELTLDPARQDYSGVIEIDLELAEPTSALWFNATRVSLGAVTLQVAGHRLALERLFNSTSQYKGFGLGVVAPAGTATLRIEFSGKTSSRRIPYGLFLRTDNGTNYLHSALDRGYVRRVIPCFDEPHFRAPWQVTIRTKPDQIAVANAPLVSDEVSENGASRSFRFAVTPPLAARELAFAVGPFDIRELGRAGRNQVPLRALVPRGFPLSGKPLAGNIARVLGQLETYLDAPYPYAKLDIVLFADRYGEADSPGLISYPTGAMTPEPGETPDEFALDQYRQLATTMPAQWLDAAIPPASWPEIWLGEALGLFLANEVTANQPGQPAPDVRERRRVRRRYSGLSYKKPLLVADREPPRPSFRGLEKLKGAALFEMFSDWLGRDKLRAGLRAVFRQNAGKSVTSAHLAAALAGATEPRLAPVMTSFIEQPGAPIVHARRTCKAGEAPSLTLTQSALLSADQESSGVSAPTWHIPVCIRYGHGERSAETCTLLKEQSATVPMAELGVCPEWFVSNREASGLYYSGYEPGVRTALWHLPEGRLRESEEMMLILGGNYGVKHGFAYADEMLALAASIWADGIASGDLDTQSAAASMAGLLPEDFVPAKLLPRYRRYVRRHFGKRARALGWSRRADDSDALHSLRRALINLVLERGRDPVLIKQAVKMARQWLKDGTGVDESNLSLVLRAAARYGDNKMFKQIVAALTTTTDRSYRRVLVRALAAVTKKPRVERVVALVGAPKPVDDIALISLSIAWKYDREGRAAFYPLLKHHFEAFQKSDKFRIESKLVSALSGFCEQDRVDDIRAFFEPRMAAVRGGPEELKSTLMDIERCVAIRKPQLPGLRKFLRRY